jgi:hypothetical protein
VIARETLKGQEAGSALLVWAQTTEKLVGRRNDLMHSFYLAPDGEQPLTRMKPWTRGGKWKGVSELVGLADITETARLLAEGMAAADQIAELLPGMAGPGRPVASRPPRAHYAVNRRLRGARTCGQVLEWLRRLRYLADVLHLRFGAVAAACRKVTSAFRLAAGPGLTSTPDSAVTAAGVGWHSPPATGYRLPAPPRRR